MLNPLLFHPSYLFLWTKDMLDMFRVARKRLPALWSRSSDLNQLHSDFAAVTNRVQHIWTVGNTSQSESRDTVDTVQSWKGDQRFHTSKNTEKSLQIDSLCKQESQNSLCKQAASHYGVLDLTKKSEEVIQLIVWMVLNNGFRWKETFLSWQDDFCS